jgi:hypothetical protein
MVLRLVGTVVTFICLAANVSAQDNCPYSLEFKSLRGTLTAFSTLEAVNRLQVFAEKNKSPEHCEAVAIDQALGERERLLIKLSSKGSKESPAHVVFRCDVFNSKTAQCQSPMEDGTAHPNLNEKVIVPLPIQKSGAFEIVSQLPDAKLYAVYLTTLSHALDGKPAKPLSVRSGVKWSTVSPSTVLIAIYKTNAPWAYRKAVWYF